MAETLTFDSLKSDVQNYLERGGSLASDPTVFEQIPRLINLAERRCATELKVLGFVEVVTGDMVAGQSVYDKPDRWKRTVSINFGTGSGHTNRTPLYPRSYEYCRSYAPNEATQAQPVFYADYDAAHWLFAPTPDDTYPFEVVYYEQPPLLDETTQTNWLTDHAPRLLLYAVLLEATPFLKNDARIPTWQAMYDREAAMLNGEDLSKIFDRAVARKEA